MRVVGPAHLLPHGEEAWAILVDTLFGVKVGVGTEAAAGPADQDLVHKEAARPSKIFSLQV